MTTKNERLICRSCARPYSKKASTELLEEIDADVRAYSLAEYPFNFTGQESRSLAAAGISTVGGLIDVGDALVTLKHFGPAKLAWAQENIEWVESHYRELYAVADRDEAAGVAATP